jgi:hypothetical protein
MYRKGIKDLAGMCKLRDVRGGAVECGAEGPAFVRRSDFGGQASLETGRHQRQRQDAALKGGATKGNVRDNRPA